MSSPTFPVGNPKNAHCGKFIVFDQRLCNIEAIKAAKKDRSTYLHQAGLRTSDIARLGFLDYTEFGNSQYFFNKGFQICGCHFAASQV